MPSREPAPRGEEAGDRGENADEGDLPGFLRNRSLRRRLDSAFDACYQSNMTAWIRGFFRRSS